MILLASGLLRNHRALAEMSEFENFQKWRIDNFVICSSCVSLHSSHKEGAIYLVMASRVSWENWVKGKAHNMNSQTPFCSSSAQPNEFIMKNQYRTLSYEFSIFNPNSFISFFRLKKRTNMGNKKGFSNDFRFWQNCFLHFAFVFSQRKSSFSLRKYLAL